MFSKKRPHDVHEVFGSSADRERLRMSGLDGFEALWSVTAAWVEAPNYRRRGWSGVCRIELRDATQARSGAYLKRQEGHCYRSARPPFRMKPTAYREYRHLVQMQTHGIAVPEVLYYGERRVGKVWQAILVTREIPQSISLEAYMRLSSERPSSEVSGILQDTGALIGRLHQRHLAHGALYGKHILLSGFVDNPSSAPPAGQTLVPYLIDLEKARFRLARWRIAVHDLNQLYRHMAWEASTWQTFLDHYMAVVRMKRIGPCLSRQITREAHRKQVNHRRHQRLSIRPLPGNRSS
jgi:tRNA A-37 threonylcarbamoyl transferase component Bud32